MDNMDRHRALRLNILKRRKYLNLSQARLGRLIGRDRHFIRRIENGATLDAVYIFDLAKALKMKEPANLLIPPPEDF